MAPVAQSLPSGVPATDLKGLVSTSRPDNGELATASGHAGPSYSEVIRDAVSATDNHEW